MGTRTQGGPRLGRNWCLRWGVDEFVEGSFFDSKNDMCLLKVIFKFRASLGILLFVVRTNKWKGFALRE